MYMRAMVYNEDYCDVMKKFISYLFFFFFKAVTLGIMVVKVSCSNSGRRIVETTLVSDFEPIYFFERV